MSECNYVQVVPAPVFDIQSGIGPQGPKGEVGPQGPKGDPAPQIDDSQASAENPWSGAKVKATIEAVKESGLKDRVSSLDGTVLTSGTIIDAVGFPAYVDSVAAYAAYGLTQTGWYVFARIAARDGVTVSGQTTVTGADGSVITAGADHVDVAVRFEVASQAKIVTIGWGTYEETFIFRASDLAVRNLDYRTTFYIYDIAPFAHWEYALTADTAFQAGKKYYTKDGDTYTLAEVQTVAYSLTVDETFQANKTYYTWENDIYTAATVTAGEAVPADTYYEQTTVPVPAYYKDGYVLTADTTFQDGTTYYTEEDGVFTAAAVTTGEAVTADTYYVAGKVRATGVFEAGTTYYTKSGTEYTETVVTTGDPIPAYYNHSKLIFEGMARNITYMFNETVDCPQEYHLPAIEDDTHGCWYEIRLRHEGTYSSTLVVPEGVKVATEHTQAETAGLNMVDLHYSNVGGVKIWRFMNTHATIPS